RMLAAAHFSASRCRQAPAPAPAQLACARASVSSAAQRGAGLEGGATVAQRANVCERPSRNGGRHERIGGRGVEANHAFEGKMPVRFAPSISAKTAQLVGASKRMIMLPYQSLNSAD
ncbi:hypothetical protein, partial [Mesorhizobium sp.]|uniref:hypothetical protein n=1 Tax=Mesorhizobium sp. TaxID=1871066 RepID=UPI003457B561